MIQQQQPTNEIYTLYYIRYPYPFRFGSYLAILRSLTIKPLIMQLYQHSQLNHQTYDRLMRTRQLIRTLIYFGLDSEKGQQAIATINHAHRFVQADNDDYLYVLSTFFLEPFRWNSHFEKNPILPQDQQIVIDFWRNVGQRMSIKHTFTALEDWQAFQQRYETEHMGYSDQGHELAIRSIEKLAKQAAPLGLRYLAQQVIIATIEPRVQRCLKLARPLIPQQAIVWLLNHVRINFEPRRDIVDKPLV